MTQALAGASGILPEASWMNTTFGNWPASFFMIVGYCPPWYAITS
jgi:hypothetical protein